jgi:hypothetical protein
MARQKKVKPYEIDFKFPRRDIQLIEDGNGGWKYTPDELLAFYYAANPDTENGNWSFANSVTEHKKEKGAFSPSQEQSIRWRFSRYSPAAKEFNDKFFSWYDSRPDMQEAYVETAKEAYWFYDYDGQYKNQEAAEAAGWLNRPLNWSMFSGTMSSRNGRKFLEMKREVVYDVGDMVQLRKPYEGRYQHDPLYSSADKDARSRPRIGTILNHQDNIDYRSRGGKGSRLLNVLWLCNGEQRQIPERTIKKLPKSKE